MADSDDECELGFWLDIGTRLFTYAENEYNNNAVTVNSSPTECRSIIFGVYKVR